MKLLSRIDAEIAVFLALSAVVAAAILVLAIKSAFGIRADWIPVYAYALGCGLTLALPALVFRSALPWLLLASVAVPLVLLAHTAAVMVVALQWCAVLSIGLIFAPARVNSNHELAAAFIIGYVVYSVALLCLVHLGLFTAGLIAAFHLAPIAGALMFRRDWLNPGSIPAARDRDPLPRSAELAILVLVFAGAIILAFFAAVPEDGSDAVAAYRPMLTDILQDGALTIDPARRSIGLLPLIELWGQAASATLAQDLHAAKIWNLSIFVFAFYVLASTASRIGPRLPNATVLLATAVIILIPAFFNVTLSAFMDNSALLMTAIMVFWCLKILAPEAEAGGFTYRNAVWAGLILGLAFISKYTLVFSIAFLVLILTGYILSSARFDRKVKTISLTAAAALVLPVSYLLFVYMVTGNPFFPLENDFWESKYFTTREVTSVHTGFFQTTLFWDMTVNTSVYSVSGAVDGTLGFPFLFGAIIACYVIVRSAINRDVGPGVWITAATFFIATAMLSWAQNSSRYVSPILALLVPSAFFVLHRPCRRHWIGFFIVMLVGHLALIPRYGYGGGIFELANAPKPAHRALYASELDRQRVADALSMQYGSQGRILDLGAQAVSIGETLESGWYDYPASTRIAPVLSDGPDALAAFLAEANIDAVVIGHNNNTRVDSANIARLGDLSQRVVQEGRLFVFHLKDEIRFDRFIEVPPVADRQQYQVTPEKGTFAWQIDYSCTESSTILRVEIVEGRWRDSVSAAGLCDGRQSSWRTPPLAADGKDASLVVFYQFPEGLKIVRAGIWHRPE